MANDFLFSIRQVAPAEEAAGSGREGVKPGPARGGRVWVTRARLRPEPSARPPAPRPAPRAQRPALFPRLCFKYLTTVPPFPRQIPGPTAGAAQGRIVGRARGEAGRGGRPGGTLRFRPVDSAVWVSGAESRGCLLVSCLPCPRSKNWETGTMGMSRTVSKAAGKEALRLPPSEGGAAPPDAGSFSAPRCACLESAARSDTWGGVAFQRKPARSGCRGREGPFLP